MADAKQADRRPLSPHLTIYRVQINTVMSIVHRLTGAALYFGTLLLAIWLISAAMGEDQYNRINALFAHPLGKLVLFGYTWAVLHHMLGGVRHFIWDTGRALTIPQVNFVSWLTIILSITLTLAVWAIAISQRGGL
jgi:succinate dehydrogenase / fumarate reductase, cytochrome b subunit